VEDMDNSKPLDALNKLVGNQVLVKLKNGMSIRGTLKAFDIHINLVLDDAEYTEEDVTKKVNTLFVRGDMILFVS
jgi:small nuclear ribonucleoprotein